MSLDQGPPLLPPPLPRCLPFSQPVPLLDLSVNGLITVCVSAKGHCKGVQWADHERRRLLWGVPFVNQFAHKRGNTRRRRHGTEGAPAASDGVNLTASHPLLTRDQRAQRRAAAVAIYGERCVVSSPLRDSLIVFLMCTTLPAAPRISLHGKQAFTMRGAFATGSCI